MIKAEVVPHDGYELPNWLTKCKDITVKSPALPVLLVVLLAIVGILLWRSHNHTAYVHETGVQSQPSASGTLPVVAVPNLSDASPLPSTPAIKSATPVGPAPTDSVSSLQSTGVTQNNVSGLTQAPGNHLQAASGTAQTVINKLGL